MHILKMEHQQNLQQATSQGSHIWGLSPYCCTQAARLFQQRAHGRTSWGLTCEAEEGDGDDGHVAKVHHHGHPLVDVQLGVKVEQGVQEQVGC